MIAFNLRDIGEVPRFPHFYSEVDLYGSKVEKSFVDDHYRKHLYFLPIDPEKEQYLFRRIIVEILKMPDSEEKDNSLWETAIELTEDGLTLKKFVNSFILILEAYQDIKFDIKLEGTDLREHILKL